MMIGIHVFSWSKEAEDVAAIRIKEASKKRMLGAHFPARESWYQRKCLSRIYFLSPIIIVACLTMLKTKIMPAMTMHNYASTFTSTQCVTSDSNMTDVQLTCDCRKNSKDTSGCKKQYPCFQMSVTIETKKGLKITTSLYEDMEALAIKYHDCVVLKRKCKKYNPADTVSSLAEHYGAPGATFHCLYNPHKPSEVLLHLVPLPGSFWAMLVTVSIVLTASALSPIIAYLTCGCMYVCARTPPADIKQEVERRKLLRTQTVELLESSQLGGVVGGGTLRASGFGEEVEMRDLGIQRQPLLMNTPPPPYQQACAPSRYNAPQRKASHGSPPTTEAMNSVVPSSVAPIYTVPSSTVPTTTPTTPCTTHPPLSPIILYVYPDGVVSSVPPPGVAAYDYLPTPSSSTSQTTSTGQAIEDTYREDKEDHMFYQ